MCIIYYLIFLLGGKPTFWVTIVKLNSTVQKHSEVKRIKNILRLKELKAS